jgi:lipoate-protein ligase A
MQEVWRLLVTPPTSGAVNMALDQALLELYSFHAQPTVRFYRWSPPCVSLGIAQRLVRDVDVGACAELGLDIVRRVTGGRAILHDDEITYSLVIAVDHPLIGGGSIVHSYRAISKTLCAGLEQLGISAQLAPAPQPDAPKSAACFDLAGDYEITVAGRKLVGSAQARKHGVLLQHGSILLHADSKRIARVLRLPAQLSSEALAQRMIALDEVLGYRPSFEDVMAAVIDGFEQNWPVKLIPATVTGPEQQRAAELVEQRYANLSWTERR